MDWMIFFTTVCVTVITTFTLQKIFTVLWGRVVSWYERKVLSANIKKRYPLLEDIHPKASQICQKIAAHPLFMGRAEFRVDETGEMVKYAGVYYDLSPPVVLLHKDMLNLPELDAVVAHELGHIQHKNDGYSGQFFADFFGARICKPSRMCNALFAAGYPPYDPRIVYLRYLQWLTGDNIPDDFSDKVALRLKAHVEQKLS